MTTTKALANKTIFVSRSTERLPAWGDDADRRSKTKVYKIRGAAAEALGLPALFVGSFVLIFAITGHAQGLRWNWGFWVAVALSLGFIWGRPASLCFAENVDENNNPRHSWELRNLFGHCLSGRIPFQAVFGRVGVLVHHRPRHFLSSFFQEDNNVALVFKARPQNRCPQSYRLFHRGRHPQRLEYQLADVDSFARDFGLPEDWRQSTPDTTEGDSPTVDERFDDDDNFESGGQFHHKENDAVDNDMEQGQTQCENRNGFLVETLVDDSQEPQRLNCQSFNFGFRSRTSRNAIYSAWAYNSLMSLLAINVVLSLVSLNSAFSVFSINSLLSLGSINSVLSVGCLNGFLKICV